MRVTVSQTDASRFAQEWQALCRHTEENASELVLLPEMPFAPWITASRDVQAQVWEDAVQQHAAWLERLPELGAAVVAGTMPITAEDGRYNVAFLWSAQTDVQPIHRKTYLPDEPGFWEASWYQRGAVDFRAVQVAQVRIGFLICTELWFMQHAREYAQQGVDLLLCPRSTPLASVDKWLAGGQAAAVVSGAFCLSSNHVGHMHGTDLGGKGWIADPEGRVLGTTSAQEPFVTVDIDLAAATIAKTTYPRYVIDTPL